MLQPSVKYEMYAVDLYRRLSGKLEVCYNRLSEYKRYKAIPLQAWTGPEGSRRLRLPDFKTIGT